jgi:hypothetical protein
MNVSGETVIDITAGSLCFVARLEESLAPQTCALFRSFLPWDQQLIHVRWSGEGIWVPMGAASYDLPWENHTSYPMPGQFIFYPGGVSETEILMSYGNVCFASKFGQLAGNHFLTIVEGMDQIKTLGRTVLYDGAQPVRFAIRT